MNGDGRNWSREGDPPRLVDDPDAGATTSHRWAVELLQGAEPYQSPAGRKQRVQLSLGHHPARRAPMLLRPVIAAGVLIGCGAIASAALGHWPAWAARAYERFGGARGPHAPAPLAVARSHASPLPDRPGVALAAGQGPAESAPQPIETPAASASRPLAAAPVALAPARDAVGPARLRRSGPANAGDDASPVLEAMRALRMESNPLRARALLGRYLDLHPNGTLAEEALAMSIEAAVAHHDGDAAALGARYLRLYPAGPFRSLARQVVGGGLAPGTIP